MAKRRKPSYADFDDDLDASIDLEESEIIETCGEQNALVGRAIYQHGFVSQRSFDGESIHATIQDGNSHISVVLSLDDFSGSCTDTRHLRRQELACEHIAALMYAYLREPDSFLPQNIGGFLDLLPKNPQARDQLAARDPSLNQVLAQIQNAPPEARTAIANLPMNPTPEQLATLASEANPVEKLKALLRNLSVEQLREIARRRGWQLSANTQAPIIEQLASSLTTAPLPAEFSPEEEQLLRLENTLVGLQDSPAAYALQKLWQNRAGGDMARLDRALRGLQSAGVLFPCAQNGAALHYHWSPLIRSEDLPLLTPKVKLYPAEKIERLTQADPVLPLATIADAVIELAEREPLRVRLYAQDSRWANQPFARGWNLDPKEMEQFAKMRFFPNNALTVPSLPFWADETNQKLEALAPDVSKWVATVLFSVGILKLDGESARVDPKQGWREHSANEHWELLWNAWRAGAGGLTELHSAAARASLVIQRSAYAQNFEPRALLQELGRAREFVARLITPLDPLVWHSFKSLAESVRGVHGDFLHTLTNLDTWFLAASKTRQRFDPHNLQHWDLAYRPVLAAIVENTLRWLGVVEVAYEGKELGAFRITALGASLLANQRVDATLAAESADSDAPSITWLDDTTIRLRATPDAARVIALVRALGDATRQSLTFRISNSSITRAFERGFAVAEIANKFAELGAPLPAALRARMDTLSANYGRVHLYEHLTVIELGDDFALRELLAGTSLSQFLVHQFSPRLVVVREEGVDAWVNEMVKKGYTPRVMTNDK